MPATTFRLVFSDTSAHPFAATTIYFFISATRARINLRTSVAGNGS